MEGCKQLLLSTARWLKRVALVLSSCLAGVFFMLGVMPGFTLWPAMGGRGLLDRSQPRVIRSQQAHPCAPYHVEGAGIMLCHPKSFQLDAVMM